MNQFHRASRISSLTITYSSINYCRGFSPPRSHAGGGGGAYEIFSLVQLRRGSESSRGWRSKRMEWICWCATQIHTLTANEGPVRIQYICLVPIYVFPEMKLLFPKHNYNVLSPSSFTHISVRDSSYTLFPGSVCLFYCREICGPILGIYKSLTDTWMWELGPRPRNS
jgi:hypothetical protein